MKINLKFKIAPNRLKKVRSIAYCFSFFFVILRVKPNINK